MLRSITMLTLVGALCACAQFPDAGIPATDGGTLVLAPGQTASLANGRMRYVRLISDSRCAPDVQCVWAGDAAIELQWMPSHGEPRVLTLHSNPQAGDAAAVLGERRVTFTALARTPDPRASLRIDRVD